MSDLKELNAIYQKEMAIEKELSAHEKLEKHKLIGAEDDPSIQCTNDAVNLPDNTIDLRTNTLSPWRLIDPAPAENAFCIFYAPPCNYVCATGKQLPFVLNEYPNLTHYKILTLPPN